MEGVFYELETQAQFLGELEEILAPFGSTPTEKGSVETAISQFCTICHCFSKYMPSERHEADLGQYLTTDEDVEGCCTTLFRSQLFIRNSERVQV